MFPTEFQYDGNRAVVFQSPKDLQLDRLEFLIRRALTYHQK